MEREGGCQCGRIRYRVAGTGSLSSICHCRMCQRASGGPFMAFVRFPVANVSWSTPPATFASSNLVERGFCPACGTPLSYRHIDGVAISLTWGSLDDPDAVPAPAVSFVPECRAGWLSQVESLPTEDYDLTVRPDFVSHQRR